MLQHICGDNGVKATVFRFLHIKVHLLKFTHNHAVLSFCCNCCGLAGHFDADHFAVGGIVALKSDRTPPQKQPRSSTRFGARVTI